MPKEPLKKVLKAISRAAFVSISLSACSDKIDVRQTQVIQGLVYKLNTDEPFTGTVINAPSIGQKTLREYGVGNCTIKFSKGLREGTSNCLASDGTKISEINFSAGESDGIQKQWDSSGRLIFELSWKKGKKDGLAQGFKDGKVIAKANWENGEKNGEEKEWDPSDQKLITNLNWSNGTATGFQKINSTTGGYSEYNLKNGNLDGAKKDYLPDGKGGTFLFKIENFSSGKSNGLTQIFNESGKVVSETNFKEGMPDGVHKEYDQNGSLLSQSEYAAGRLVSTATTSPTANSKDTTTLDECVDAKIAGLRKKSGEEAIVSNDMIEEWKSLCK